MRHGLHLGTHEIDTRFRVHAKIFEFFSTNENAFMSVNDITTPTPIVGDGSDKDMLLIIASISMVVATVALILLVRVALALF